MKKTLLTLLLSTSLFAQKNETVDLFNVNVSLLGAGVQYEKAIGKKFTALAMIDYAGGINYTNNFSGGSNTDFLFTTSFGLEGRYYYNLEKRAKRRRVNTFNSGNYFALNINYLPDLFTKTNSEEKDFDPQASLFLNYGIKRSFATSFFYEIYAGLGLTTHKDIEIILNSTSNDTYTFDYEKVTTVDSSLNVGLRLGYNF